MIANAIMSCIKKRSSLIMKYAKNLLWFFTVSIVLTPPIAARRGLTSRQVRQLRNFEKKFNEHMLTFRRNADRKNYDNWQKIAYDLIDKMKRVDPATPRARETEKFLKKKLDMRTRYKTMETALKEKAEELVTTVGTTEEFEKWKQDATNVISKMKDENINPKLLANLEKNLIQAQTIRKQKKIPFAESKSNLTNFLKNIDAIIEKQVTFAKQDNPNFTKIYAELKKIKFGNYSDFTDDVDSLINTYSQQVDKEKWETHKQNVTDQLNHAIYILANRYMDAVNKYLEWLDAEINTLIDDNLPDDLEESSRTEFNTAVNSFEKNIETAVIDKYFMFQLPKKKYKRMLFYEKKLNFLEKNVENQAKKDFVENMNNLLVVTGKKTFETWKTIVEENIDKITESAQATLLAETLLTLFDGLGNILDPEQKLSTARFTMNQHGKGVFDKLEKLAEQSVILAEVDKMEKEVQSNIETIEKLVNKAKEQAITLETIRDTIIKDALGKDEPNKFASKEEKKKGNLVLHIRNIVDNIGQYTININTFLSSGTTSLETANPLIEAQENRKAALEENLETYQKKLETLQDETKAEIQKSDKIGTHVTTAVAAVGYAAEAQEQIAEVKKGKAAETIVEEFKKDERFTGPDELVPPEKLGITEAEKEALDKIKKIIAKLKKAENTTKSADIKIEKLTKDGVKTESFTDKTQAILQTVTDKIEEYKKASKTIKKEADNARKRV